MDLTMEQFELDMDILQSKYERVNEDLEFLIRKCDMKYIAESGTEDDLTALYTEANEQANEAEAQITERWKSDNEHVITRLVRPISFGWVIMLFSVVIIGDTNWGFTVKDAYIPVIETLLVTMTVAYYGGRSFEKFKKGGS